MAEKRGQVEVQFNWILILVAGGLIFLFFFGIINWAKKSSDEGTASTISVNLDSIFTGSSIVKETINKIDIPFKQLDFTCDTYRVDSSSNVRNIRNKLIFAPSRIDEGRLITWSLGWDIPFRVTNFLFITSPQIRYIVIGSESSDMFQLINETFPREFNVEFNPSTIEDVNNFKVRFIYVGGGVSDADAALFYKMPDEDVTALWITSSDPYQITFYKKTIASFSVIPYTALDSAGLAGLFGAIISENPEDYDCNMEKAKKRLDQIAEIYLNRSRELETYYSGTICEEPHSIARIAFETYISDKNLPKLHNATTIQNENAQRHSCALIY